MVGVGAIAGRRQVSFDSFVGARLKTTLYLPLQLIASCGGVAELTDESTESGATRLSDLPSGRKDCQDGVPRVLSRWRNGDEVTGSSLAFNGVCVVLDEESKNAVFPGLSNLRIGGWCRATWALYNLACEQRRL